MNRKRLGYTAIALSAVVLFMVVSSAAGVKTAGQLFAFIMAFIMGTVGAYLIIDPIIHGEDD